MKKQILAAAIAAVIATPAMADISISGNANFEYTHVDDDGTTKNGTDTEINLMVKGTNGDTTVVANLEIDSAGTTGSNDDDARLDIEDTYITTKLGPVSIKGGNYTSSNSGLLGEIENGGRADDKVTLSYSMKGVQVYAGNSGTHGEDTQLKDSNMFAGVQATVAGWKLQLKKNNEDKSSFGLAGKYGPVGVRAEIANSDTDSDNGYFLDLTSSINGIDIGYAMIDMDKSIETNGGTGKGIEEDDSSIFAVSVGAGATNNQDINAISQLSVGTSIAGTTYSVKVGSLSSDVAGKSDRDFYEVYAKRMLTSGTTAKISYLSQDTSSTADKSTFEIDLSVKF